MSEEKKEAPAEKVTPLFEKQNPPSPVNPDVMKFHKHHDPVADAKLLASQRPNK